MNLAQTGAIASGIKALLPQLIGGAVQILVTLYGIGQQGNHTGTDAEFFSWLSHVWVVSLLGYLAGTGAGSGAKSFFKFFEIKAEPSQTVSVTVPTASTISVDPLPKP